MPTPYRNFPICIGIATAVAAFYRIGCENWVPGGVDSFWGQYLTIWFGRSGMDLGFFATFVAQLVANAVFAAGVGWAAQWLAQLRRSRAADRIPVEAEGNVS
jgi:hypothetical protein